MIKTETEYRLTLKQIEKNRDTESKQRAALAAAGLSLDNIEIAMEPVLTFHQQMLEEAQWYERVRAGDITPIQSLGHIGQALIGLRIAQGMTQKELAARLGVSEGVISRDERNEYHGISVERAQRILDALEGQATLVVTPTAKLAAPVHEFAMA
jgi:DNA-binding XRE family transcriptional regulator